MDGVEQGGPAKRPGMYDLLIEVIGIGRERDGQPGPVAELHEEELVPRVGVWKKAAAASAAFRMRGPILLLMSRSNPTETGASSWAK